MFGLLRLILQIITLLSEDDFTNLSLFVFFCFFFCLRLFMFSEVGYIYENDFPISGCCFCPRYHLRLIFLSVRLIFLSKANAEFIRLILPMFT